MAFVPDQPTGGFVPDEEPSRLAQTGRRVLRGLFQGGPIGAATAGVKEGLAGLDEASDTAGGAVTDTLAPHVPAEVAAAAGTVLKVGIPAVVGGVPGRAAGQPAMEAGARTLMRSALKPDPVARAGGANSDAAKAIQTMLDEGALATQGGAAKMRELVTKLNADVMKRIADSTEIVDKGHAMRETFKVLQKFRKQVNPEADMQKIRASWDEFNRNVADIIPISEAQALKQGTYGILAEKYARGGTPAIENEAATQAQMAQARGLRLGIEEKIPEVGALNAREAALINAIEIAEKRTGVAGNRDMAGIAWLASNPKMFAAALADRSPAFKSMLAQILYQGRKTVPATAGAVSAHSMGEAP